MQQGKRKMSSAARPIQNKKARKPTIENTANGLMRMVEKKLAELPREQRMQKRQRLMDLLDGNR